MRIDIVTLSLLAGMLLLASVTNLVGDIYDIPHNSGFFSISLVAVAIGCCSFFLRIPSTVRFTFIDVLFTVVALGYWGFHLSISNLWTMGYLSLFLIYWAVRLAGRVNYGILYYSALVTPFLLALIGYLQFAKVIPGNHPYFNITGPFGSPAIYAGVMCLLLSALVTWCLYPGYRSRYKSRYYFTLAVCVSCLPIFVIADSRTAWIALLVAIARPIYMFHLRVKSIFIRFRAYFVFIMLLFVVLASCSLYQLKPDSAQGRILIWKVTWRMIQEKPLTGFGSEGFATHYMHYQASYLESAGTPHEKYLAGSNHLVYNEPLRLVVEYGVAGLLLYACLVYAVIVVPRRKDVVTLSAQSLLTTYLVWGLFAYPNQVFPIQAVAALALVCLSCRCRKSLIVFRTAAFSRQVVPGVLLAVTIGLAFMLTSTYLHYRKFYQVISTTSQNQLNESIRKLASLETAMQHEPAFWMYYCTVIDRKGADFLLSEKIIHWERLYPTPDTYIMKGDLLQRLGRCDEAESIYQLAANMVPTRQRARSRLSLLYHQRGREEEALRLACTILTEKVKVYGFETYEIHKELRRIFEDQLK